MRKYISLFVILLLAGTGVAQENQYQAAADSDPEARALLDQLRARYEGLDPLRAAFTLRLQFAEQPEEVQEGVLLRSGERYRVSMGNRDVLSDGSALYLILHHNKEIQINDLPDEEEAQGAFSPQNILSLHESDQFAYVLGGRVSRQGRLLQQVEFKPLDPYADYSKLRMEVDPATLDLVSATAFGKDGSRYVFELQELGAARDLDPATFTFSPDNYPDYYVEDLRQ